MSCKALDDFSSESDDFPDSESGSISSSQNSSNSLYIAYKSQFSKYTSSTSYSSNASSLSNSTSSDDSEDSSPGTTNSSESNSALVANSDNLGRNSTSFTDSKSQESQSPCSTPIASPFKIPNISSTSEEEDTSQSSTHSVIYKYRGEQIESIELILETDSSQSSSSTSSSSSLSRYLDIPLNRHAVHCAETDIPEPTSPQVYQMAAERVHCARLGFYTRYGGSGLQQDHAASVFWYEAARDMGCSDSLAALAVAYIFGIGVEVDHTIAQQYLRQAMLQGSVDALEIRGLCWMNGIFNQPDYALCTELFAIGIARNSTSCLLWAGFCFEMGLGVDPDPISANNAYKAVCSFSLASLNITSVSPGLLAVKDPWVLMKMALFLLHTDGKLQNRIYAVKCLSQAANLGFSNAKMYLAMCLLEGKWLIRDVKRALYWVRNAAADTPPHPMAVKTLEYYEKGSFSSPLVTEKLYL